MHLVLLEKGPKEEILIRAEEPVGALKLQPVPNSIAPVYTSPCSFSPAALVN